MGHRCNRCCSCNLWPDPKGRIARYGYAFTAACHLIAWGALGLVILAVVVAMIAYAITGG